MTSRPQRTLATRVRRLAVLGFTALAALWFLRGRADAWFFWPEDSSIVHGSRDELGVRVEPLRLTTPDGAILDAWLLHAAAPRQGSVVFCHGNAANITLHASSIAWLARRGFDVLCFDYRGYGASTGKPSREGLVTDTLTAIDFVLARDPEHTVVFGHSLGGAIAILAVARRPAVRALVVESTFPTWREAAAAQAPWLSPLVPLLVTPGDDPIDVIDRVAPRPFLIVHGDDDRIIPIALARELFARAQEPKSLHVAHASGHATPWKVEGAEFEALVTGFMRDALAR